MVDKHGVLWNKEKLRVEDIAKWKPLTDRGAPVHVGEWGCFNLTPHDACLAWMADRSRSGRRPAGAGPCGTCAGPSASSTAAARTSPTRTSAGHKLDRRMLELLLAG